MSANAKYILIVLEETDLKTVIQKVKDEKCSFEVDGRSVVLKDIGDMKLVKKWCDDQGIKTSVQ